CPSVPARRCHRRGRVTPGYALMCRRLRVGLESPGSSMNGESAMGHNGTPLDSIGRVLDASSALTWSTRYARTPGGQNAVFTRRGMEKPQVSGHSDGQECAVCKTVGLAYVGSNPT